MFITFEGPEGCGKSTQARELKVFLESRGKEVVLTHEPGGTALGTQIRDLLLHSKGAVDAISELCLFAADRAEHMRQLIMPSLSSGKIVISDRFVDSTLAYQIGGRGLPEDLVRYLNMISSKGIMPDITFLLDVSPEIGLKRATRVQGADRFEQEKIVFHAKVRQKYLEIAQDNPKRVIILNTEENGVDEIKKEIQHIIYEKCGN